MLKNKIHVCDPIGENITIKDTPMATFVISIILAAAIICYSLSCVSPGAVKTEAMAKIASVENNLNKLEKIVDTKVDAKVIAETIDNFKQEFNQQLFKYQQTIDNKGIIKYGGAGWVIISSSSMVIIFLLAIFLSIKYFLKSGKNDSMLQLVTKVIKNLDPETQTKVKAAIETETSNGGIFTVKHKILLANFTKANNTFIEK